MNSDDAPGSRSEPGLFRTTHWSVVLAAREGDASQVHGALEALCRAYWYPLYGFIRSRGHTVEDAQDLTQEFFARLLRRDFLRNVAREKGRFRTFLLTSLKNFLASEWRRGQAVKRGGGRDLLSWEELEAEPRYAQEPASEETPEARFDKCWALTVMSQAMERLGEEFAGAGKRGQFERMKPFLSSEGSKEDYERLAVAIESSAGAVAVAVHRLRRRFAAVLRSVVANTVAGPDEIEEEVRLLAQALHDAG